MTADLLSRLYSAGLQGLSILLASVQRLCKHQAAYGHLSEGAQSVRHCHAFRSK